MAENYYVLNLWDYGTPAFVSFDKMYVGTETEIRTAIESMKQENKNDETVAALERYFAGGSGCGCAATVLTSYVLPKIASGQWKRVLFVPTGALLSKVSFYEGNSVPGIAQAVVLEYTGEV